MIKRKKWAKKVGAKAALGSNGANISFVKIGVLAGVFDPVHEGHINFISRAIKKNSLNKVLILIEKKPKHKPIFADYFDRKNMLQIAIKDEPKIEIFESAHESWPISNNLPEIKSKNPNSKIYLLAGKDVIEHMESWAGSDELLKNVEIVVAERNDGIRSGNIRQAIKTGNQPQGLDDKIKKYIKQNNLYRQK